MEWDEAPLSLRIDSQARRNGFSRRDFPREKYGGAGMGYIEYVIIIEELSRVDGSIGIIVAAHNSLAQSHL